MSPNFASCWRRSTMTQADLFRWLLESTCASSAAIVLVLLLRRPLRATFGANAAYLLWLLPPLAVLAASRPAPVVQDRKRVGWGKRWSVRGDRGGRLNLKKKKT